MKSTIIFLPYKMGSVGAKELARLLNGKRVYPDRNYIPRTDHVIINWGTSEFPHWMPIAMQKNSVFLNNPVFVGVASNKLQALRTLYDAGVRVPPFTTSKKQAKEFFRDTRRVYCRTLLTASGGKGIIVANNPDDLVDAPLYTAGIDRKRDEFRVHVFRDEIIDYVMKRKMSDETIAERGLQYCNQVRNHDNGWVFARTDVKLPAPVASSALDAIRALELDFGAVDIIMRESQAYVLEVNTAPGLEGTTLERYKDRITSLFSETPFNWN